MGSVHWIISDILLPGHESSHLNAGDTAMGNWGTCGENSTLGKFWELCFQINQDVSERRLWQCPLWSAWEAHSVCPVASCHRKCREQELLYKIHLAYNALLTAGALSRQVFITATRNYPQKNWNWSCAPQRPCAGVNSSLWHISKVRIPQSTSLACQAEMPGAPFHFPARQTSPILAFLM